MRGKKAELVDPHEAAVGRIQSVCSAFQGAGLEYIPVGQVLDLLKPDGHWGTDGKWQEGQPAAETPQPADPRADPLLGTFPVTAGSDPAPMGKWPRPD